MTTTVTGILRDVWELQVVQVGDQGGMVGSWVRWFESKEAAHTWFEKYQKEDPDGEYCIFKEQSRYGIVVDHPDWTKLYLLDGKTPKALTV